MDQPSRAEAECRVAPFSLFNPIARCVCVYRSRQSRRQSTPICARLAVPGFVAGVFVKATQVVAILSIVPHDPQLCRIHLPNGLY